MKTEPTTVSFGTYTRKAPMKVVARPSVTQVQIFHAFIDVSVAVVSLPAFNKNERIEHKEIYSTRPEAD